MVGRVWGFWCGLFLPVTFNLELFAEGKSLTAWNRRVSGSQLVPVDFAPGCGVSLRPKYIYASLLHWCKACAPQMLICRKSQKRRNPCHYSWLKELLNGSSRSLGASQTLKLGQVPTQADLSRDVTVVLSRDLLLSLDALSSQSTFYHYSLAWPLIIS